MDTDERKGRLAVLPTFRQPPSRTPDQPLPADPPAATDPDPTRPAATEEDPSRGPRRWSVLGTRRPGAGTRTGTSSAGELDDNEPVQKPSAAEVTTVAVGLLGLVVAGAVALTRWRTGRKLREPTRQQRHDIAAPISRIILRHSDLSWLNKDLADVLAAGTAVGAYVNEGPMLEGPATNPGEIPQEDQL